MGRKEVFDLKSSKAKEIPDKEDGLNENEGSQFEKKYEKDSQKPSKLEAEEPTGSQFGEKYEKDSQKPPKQKAEETGSRIERKYEEDSQKPRKRKAKEPSEDGEDGSASDVKSDDSVSLNGAASDVKSDDSVSLDGAASAFSFLQEGEDGEDGAASGSRIERKYEEDSQQPRKRKAKEPRSQFGKKYGKNSRKPLEPKADEFGWSFHSACDASSSASLGDYLINEFKPPVKVVPLPQPKEPVKQGDIPQPKGS